MDQLIPKDDQQTDIRSWSDFVVSSPKQQQTQQQPVIDTIFTQLPSSRRHSVTVGEMNFHSFDQNRDIFGTSLPSSWSSSSSSSTRPSQIDIIPHRRAMSLRLDTQVLHDFHHHSTASPTTPAFFSPGFLDALNQEDDIMFDASNQQQQQQQQQRYHHHLFSDDIIHNFMMNNNTEQINPNQLVTMSTTVATAATAAAAATTTATITPSIISNDTKTSNWYFKLPPNDKRKLSSSSANTNTSSPPHTTPSPPTYYPSIPEEEDEDMDNQQRNSLMLQGANDIAIIKPLIQTYLTHFEGERKITILTSRVAQKSYGTEKRFLCPPPYTILSGASWFTTSKPPNIVVHITGEKTSQNSVIEWRQHNNTLMDSTLSTLLNDSTKMNNITGNCVSRNLHINDADEKRKRVEVLVKITLGNGSLLGTLPSKSIKVISKPSKKRQSVKNMELCIHHGSAVALFNRIRSQTVSTKYLGVSSTENDASTCFVARTNSWDPFIVWIVDTTRSPDSIQPPLVHHPDDPQFPAPPAIAIQYTKSQQQQQPIALHYNQPIVLQCVTTGLVSPVMVIRRVDKGSWVVGGNRLDDLSVETGGECGDEALGDPVSQLHKVAFQIVHDPSIAHHNKSQSNPLFNSPTEWTLPQATQSATYLACLDNVVGMHRTTSERRVIVPRPNPPPPPTMDALWPQEMVVDNHEGGGKMIRKRRVSCDVTGKSTSTLLKGRRRVNSLTIDNNNNNGKEMGAGRRMSSDRRSSLTGADSYTFNGSCWTEDVSDAAVWTIVGTDYVQYKFWTPPPMISDLNSPFSVTTTRSPITPFPIISTIQTNQEVSGITQLMLHGQGFTRDISVWFGDIKSSHTDYKSREFISCLVPDIQDMLNSKTKIKVEDESQSSPIMYQIPLLFVRSDGIVYNTDRFYIF